MTTPPPARRGRPKLVDDDEIFDRALRMFAVHGYEGMSLRSLNRELGLSHGTVNQRFGTKERLYREVLDHGLGGLIAELRGIVAGQPRPTDPIEELHLRFRAFVLASGRRPHINRLMNNEGIEPSWHLDHIYDNFIEPALRRPWALVQQLVEAGVFEPVSKRSMFFLVAHGASSAFDLEALSAKFDATDGPLDPERHADETARMIVNAMRRTPATR